MDNIKHTIYRRILEFHSKIICGGNKLKKKSIFYLAGIVTLLIFILCYALSYVHSKEYTISRLKDALLKNDSKTAVSLIKSSDKKLIINEKTIKSFFEYLNKDPKNVQNLLNTIYRQSAALDGKKDPECWNYYLTLKKSGSYYFEMKPCFVDLNVHDNSVNIYIDDKFVCTSDKDNFSFTCGPYVQGQHKVTTVYKSPLGNFEDSKSVNFISVFSKEGKPYNYFCYLPLNYNFIRLTCNFNDAEIFVTGTDIGKTVKDFSVFGPVNKLSDTVIYVQKEFPWGTLRSKDYEINKNTSADLDMSIDAVNEEVLNELKNAIAEYNKKTLVPALKDRSTSFLSPDDPSAKQLKNQFDILSSNNIYFHGDYLHSDISADKISIFYSSEKDSYFASVISKDYYSEDYGQSSFQLSNPFIVTSKAGKTNSYYASYNLKERKWTIENIYCQG